MTESVNTTHVLLTGVAIALTLLAAATHLLLPIELSSPLTVGSGITLYLLVNGLPYTKNQLFALFIILTCTSAAAITMAAGAARMQPDQIIRVALQMAIPMILSCLITLAIINLIGFTIQLILSKLYAEDQTQQADNVQHPASRSPHDIHGG